MAFASFDGKRGSMPVADINMVPLIDVMLVLLVIFIVTAPLMTHAVKLQLPQASAQVPKPPARKLDLAIDAQGRRYLDGQVLSRTDLAERLAHAMAASTDAQNPPELQLRADQAAAYRAVAETLADASRAGLTRIAFISQPEPR